MHRRWFAILFCVVMSFPAVAGQGVRPVAVFQLEPHSSGTHAMTLHARVRGQQGLFLFDTGGGVTYLTPAFSKTIGCNVWGQLTGFVLTGQRLDMQRCDDVELIVDNQRLRAPIAGVFDIMKFMPNVTPKLDGSIGLDAFAGRAITLSLANQTLTLESAASLRARQRTGKEVQIRLVREAEGIALAVVVGVVTPQGIAWMELDSGNGGANVIAKHIAPLLNLKTGIKEPQPAKFTLVGGIPVTGEARVNETLTMDGNIGTRFLINWDLTLDLANGRAWLTPAKSKRNGSR
jgi:hypothetical protein